MNSYPKEVFGKSVGKVPQEILDAYSAEDIQYMIDFLKRYSRYCAEKVHLSFPNTDNNRLTERDIDVVQQIDSQPSFRITLRGGGRMGPNGQSYHSLSQAARLECKINEEAIQEIDLQGAGLQFIDILTGGKIFPSQQEGFDPYESLSQNAGVIIEREKVKKAFKMLFDPKNRSDTSRIRQILGADSPDSQAVDTFMQYLYDVVEKSMSELSAESGLPINFLIYRQESTFLRALLERIMEHGFHCLPLNDSYLFPIGQESQMRKLIKNTSKEVFDTVLSFK